MQLKFTQYDALIPLKDLIGSPHQRNGHPQEQIERLALIMREEGVRHPIHVSKQSKFICFGHGRREAALLNGWTEFPVVYQNFDSDEQEYRCVQSDNGIASWSSLDLSKINLDIGNMGPFNIDLLGIMNFDVVPPITLEPQCDEDEVPEPKESIAKLGDIWILGRHRLMCGDSTSIDAVEKLMNGEKADMVFTDPPYGIDLQTDYELSLGSGSLTKGREGTNQKVPETKKYKKIIGDSEPFDPGTLLGYFDYCEEVFLWGANYYWEHLSNSIKSSIVVWDKRVSDGLRKMHGNQLELCWSKSKHSQKVIPLTWCGAYGSDEGKAGHKKVHPTQKPVKLAEFFLDEWSSVNDKIIDLFGGSGSTLIACEKTQRKCFMMELDPHYVDVIIARWEKYTGKKGELVGETS